jgi:hypothetical protein
MRIGTGVLGCHYGIADLVAKLWPPYRKCILFQTWPLSVRVALPSQIRWHIRAELTCDVGYAFDPVTAVAVGSRLKFGAAEWKR